MRFGVLGDGNGWHLRDLQRAAAERRLELLSFDYRQLTSRIGSRHATVAAGSHSLTECDALLLRSVPAGSLEQTIFRMDALGVLAHQLPIINPPRTIELAVDKYLTLARLSAAGIPVPETIACQSPADALSAFDQLGGDVVLKPLFGSEGRGLVRLTDRALLERAAMLIASHGGILYLQQFVPHPGYDLRVLLIGQDVFAIRRHNPHDWRTNISRGARAEPCQPEDQCLAWARQAADLLGASVAGVDLLTGDDGRWLVLEVNAVPGWKGVAQAHHVDLARLMLDHVAVVASQMHKP
jgi:ribosomal protein S6--L-glutamate ligase